jgi:hypothetical protein
VRSLIRITAALLLLAGAAPAEPVFKIIRPDSILGPGKTVPVWVHVKVKAEKSVYRIWIEPACPPGFLLTPDSGQPQPIIVNSTRDSNDLLVPFKLTVPGLKSGWNELLVSAGRKQFALNYSYQDEKSPDPVRRYGTFSITYVPSLFLYLVFGLAGILLGFYAKINIKNSRQINEMPAPEDGTGKVKQMAQKAGAVVGSTVPNLLTTLILGLAVLLTLARSGIPVEHCYFALPLGIGLAMLADEELISKVNVK